MITKLNPFDTQSVLFSANWLGMWTLYLKEVHRYLKIIGQTLFAPIVTTLLFLIVFSVAFGNGRAINGIPYIEFLSPGLLMMTILQNAFANTSTSLIQQKLNQNIVDTLMPPLSPIELTIGFVLSGATRGLMVAIGVGTSLFFLVSFSFHSITSIVFFSISAALMMSSLGIMTGIWAEKFDHVSTISNFVILPLSFLSGTFFPITRFEESFQFISYYNPFFYLIDGLRYGFTGQSIGSIEVGTVFIIVMNFLLCGTCYWMFRTGYKIKD